MSSQEDKEIARKFAESDKNDKANKCFNLQRIKLEPKRDFNEESTEKLNNLLVKKQFMTGQV